MPPEKSNNPKRSKEQHIQAWFEFAERPDNGDLSVVRYFNHLRNLGWSPKRIIGESILCLKDKRGDVIEEEMMGAASQTDLKLDQIWSVLKQLTSTIENAGLRIDGETQAVIDQVNHNREEFTALEESLAQRTTVYRFDDEEEDN